MNGRGSRLVLVIIALLLATRVVQSGAAAGDADGAVAILRARTIELVDTDGRVRASLRTESDGAVVLRMMGASGDIRVKVAASDDGSGLVLLDDRSELGVHALADRKEGTSLVLAERGKERRVLEP